MTDRRADDTQARLAALKARQARPTGEKAPAGRRRSSTTARLTAAGMGVLAVSGLTVAFATQDSTEASEPATTAAENPQPVVVVVRWADGDPAADPTVVPVVELAAQPSTRVATTAIPPAATTAGSG